MSDDWLHLKAYGYAPGHYMSKCHRCGETPLNMDKRAVTCKPCATLMHEEHLRNQWKPPVPIGVTVEYTGDFGPVWSDGVMREYIGDANE